MQFSLVAGGVAGVDAFRLLIGAGGLSLVVRYVAGKVRDAIYFSGGCRCL